MLVERKAYCHVANAFLDILVYIRLKISKMSKKYIFCKNALGVNGLRSKKQWISLKHY